MINYKTSPNLVGALQERFQSRGIMPQYRVVHTEGARHPPTFIFQVLYYYTAVGREPQTTGVFKIRERIQLLLLLVSQNSQCSQQ